MLSTAIQAIEEERNLHWEAHQEAECHKWIESQKHGHDVGETAIQEWYHVHWPHYCRCKRLEHLGGLQRWDEFNDEPFGHLYSLLEANELLVDRILDRILSGHENLTLINWAMEWGLPEEKVHSILLQINVNRSRLEPAIS